MTSSNTLLKQMLAAYRQRKRIQALLLCLAMLVSMLTMVSLTHNGIAVTMDDAEPVLGETAVQDTVEQNEPDEPPAPETETETPESPADPAAEASGDEGTPGEDMPNNASSGENSDPAADPADDAEEPAPGGNDESGETEDADEQEPGFLFYLKSGIKKDV